MAEQRRQAALVALDTHPDRTVAQLSRTQARFPLGHGAPDRRAVRDGLARRAGDSP